MKIQSYLDSTLCLWQLWLEVVDEPLVHHSKGALSERLYQPDGVTWHFPLVWFVHWIAKTGGSGALSRYFGVRNARLYKSPEEPKQTVLEVHLIRKVQREGMGTTVKRRLITAWGTKENICLAEGVHRNEGKL